MWLSKSLLESRDMWQEKHVAIVKIYVINACLANTVCNSWPKNLTHAVGL